MSKFLDVQPRVIPLVLGTALFFSQGNDPAKVLAQTPINSNSFGQVTSVSQLRDVNPTDWAYEALRSLVERYGCIVGYPDKTFRGTRAISRWEFAAGLNACLNALERLIQENVAIAQEDIEKLKRLTQEFAAELKELSVRVDNLEGRVAVLEANQFSTTTKLQGEIVFGLAGIVAGDDALGKTATRNTQLGYRARLYLNTSFTGKDTLYTELASSNMIPFSDVLGYYGADLSFSQNYENKLVADWVAYNTPIGPNTDIWVEGIGGSGYDFIDTINFLYGDGVTGALSYFGNLNPIYYQVYGSGFAINHKFNDQFRLNVGYLADSISAANPKPGHGLFNGSYGAVGQLVFNHEDIFEIGLAYIHSYNQVDTFTGGRRANFIDFVQQESGLNIPTVGDSYGLDVSWKITDGFVLGGWVGYTNARTLSGFEDVISRGSYDIWNWAVTLAFPDLGKEGSVAGIIVGMQPKVTSSSVKFEGVSLEDKDTSMHIEAFYQFQLTDNIAITPGLIMITSPDHNSNNNDLLMGVIRTTFTF